MSTTNTISITTDGPNPPREIQITLITGGSAQGASTDDPFERSQDGVQNDDGQGTVPMDRADRDDRDTIADDLVPLPPAPDDDATTIGNIRITTHGPKPPAEIQVTVTCDITNTRGHTPRVFFPAQGMGIPMTHCGGNTWTVSNSQMYSRGEKVLTIVCNGVKTEQKFKA
ncbi:hypothetical protein [Magnetovibrio sp.]|uniref:hypothetical protein n=1 Tax=Magnetovibrio sp. TaxID=2024836 RepID=UPI002F94E1E2